MFVDNLAIEGNSSFGGWSDELGIVVAVVECYYWFWLEMGSGCPGYFG